MHGARGVIFVNDTANHGGGGELDKFESAVGPGGAGIPFVHIKADVADRWLEAGGASMSAIQSSIDKELKPRSFALPDSLEVRLRVDIDRELKDVRNVAGYLPGDRPEYVVIGAHYDHIGLGHQYSMAPAEAGKPHPGADDNASGVAGVIELARWFAQPRRPRGMLFLAFAGEELGLLGSSHWVNHAELPLNRAVAMINLDMIGRIRDGRVYIGGVGTGSTFRGLFDPPQTEGGLKIDFSDATGYGSSDHASFTTKDVPVLFFFSGLHDDYHRPGDTWEKISARETTQLLELVARVTSRLAESDTRPRFIPARAIRPDGNQD
jgi:hypothetical protein